MSNYVELGSWFSRLQNVQKLEMDTANKVREISDPFVPFLSGHLAANVEVTRDDTGAHVTYNEPYAHYQYVHPEFKHTTTFHEQASGQWVEQAIQANPSALEHFVEGQILNG